MTEGIIVKVSSGIYTVSHPGGKTDCRLRGKFRIDGTAPVAGDKCKLSFADDGAGVITEILPRKNSLIRPKLANIDNLLIVFAAKNPEPQPGVIDRLTVTAEQKGIRPIIVITKADIADGDEIAKYRDIYESAGYKVIVTSKDDEEDTDELLREDLHGKITAVAGCSGVGKSTLINKMFGIDNLRTGEISAKNLKGRHTTTCIELFEKFDGFVADTPGFSSLEIFEAEKEDLENLFPEIKSRLGSCRFTGCSHITEPDCPIKEAVEKGEIHPLRYESYVKLYTDLKNRKKY